MTAEDIRRLAENREVFPLLFWLRPEAGRGAGAAGGPGTVRAPAEYPDAFGARVFKISRDARGERLAWMKITGGSLRVKALLSGGGEAPWEEKVNQIRIYSGGSYRLEQQAEAGRICAVSGLSRVRAGEGLGSEPAGEPGLLEPVLTYRLILPEDTDPKKAMEALESLEEEEPMLRAARDPETGEISVRVMGQVQMEILQQLLKVRYGLRAEFGAGSIIYKETIFLYRGRGGPF